MLFFAPVRFDDEIAILSPADLFEQLARAFCSSFPPEAHRNPHPDYAQVIALTNRASEAIKGALEQGELAAFAVLEDGREFFRVPGEYWQSTTSYFLGKIFAFPADQLVPRQFQDARVVIRRDDWLAWLAKAGVELPFDHGVPLAVAIGRLVQPEGFDPNAPAEVAPWWSVLQTIGWVATASRAYVSHLGSLESERNDEMRQTITFSALEVYVRQSHCKCGAQGLPAEVRWEHCTCPGDAGRSLLEAIRRGRVTAIDQSAFPARRLEFFELAGIGQRSTCSDWVTLTSRPVFSSAEVIAAFPVTRSERPENLTKERKRPGPAPDPDWPHAIAKVTRDCIAAGYKRARKRGDKAAIQTMLLNYMAEKDKNFSDDIAARHAETVIAALSDN
jgi:hypothetical protein